MPYFLIKALAYILAYLGVSQLSGTLPLLIIVLIAIIAPLASGYLGARYSKSLPLVNGLAATSTGIVAFVVFAQPDSLLIYAIFAVLALIFGYFGARRYVLHG